MTDHSPPLFSNAIFGATKQFRFARNSETMILQYRLYDLSDCETNELERSFNSTKRNQAEIGNAHRFIKEAKKSKEGKFSVEIEWVIDDKQSPIKQKEAYAELMRFIKPFTEGQLGKTSGSTIPSAQQPFG